MQPLKMAEEIAHDGFVSMEKFIWHAVTRAAGYVKNHYAILIKAID